MTRIRVHCLSVSLDGFVAGPDQGPEDPLGVGGLQLHQWLFDGSVGVDEAWLRRGDAGIGATVMGRNMFGPVRGAWSDETWTGWWGSDPPFHHDVFVLTHHERPPLRMEGGTTFHFVTDGLDRALELAAVAAGGLDVRIGGGAATVRTALARGLVDDLHVVVVPVLLVAGERLWDPVGEWPRGYALAEREASDAVTHYLFRRAP
jgi:dihydrofolate reductase